MNFEEQLFQFRDWALDFEGTAQKWMWSAVAFVAAYLLGAITATVIRFAARKLAGFAKPTRAQDGDAPVKTADHVMFDILGVVVRIAFFAVATAISANLLVGYSLDDAWVLALAALKGLIILIAVWFLGSWIGSRVRSFGQQVGKRTNSGGETLFNFLAGLVRFGAFAIGLIAALQQFGFDTASLLAVIGAAGLAIALALQDTLKAVAAGVVIAVFRPYRIGDIVEIAGQSGTVADITPFNTVLNTIDNREVVITNDQAWGNVIINSSARSMRRLDLLLSIDYDDDIEKAIRIVSGILESDPRVRDEPPVWVKAVELSSSSIDLRARAWVATSDWWETRCDTLQRVKVGFDKAGITIPYPHQVNVEKHDLPAISGAKVAGQSEGKETTEQ